MKRMGMIGTTLGVAMLLGATSLQAAAAPAKTVIEDPLGDANFVNDQGLGDGTVGDVNAADAGSASDLTAVTFSNDAKNLIVYFETEAAPPAITGVGLRVRVNPDGPAGTHCLYVETFFSGANNNLTAAQAHLRDGCGGGDPVPLKILGTTVTVPRKAHEAFAKGSVLKAPQAQSFLYSGTYPAGVSGPMVDTTKVGTDYRMVDKAKKKRRR